MAEVMPDLIILDINMPGMGGLEVLKRAREIDKEVGIIMVTAVNEKLPLKIGADLDEGYLPVDRFLEKPVDPAVLLGLIAEVLGRGRA